MAEVTIRTNDINDFSSVEQHMMMAIKAMHRIAKRHNKDDDKDMTTTWFKFLNNAVTIKNNAAWQFNRLMLDSKVITD